MGVPDQAMRIWMNPDRMASLGITTTDIANAINQQNQLVRRGSDRAAAQRGHGGADVPGGDAAAVHRSASSTRTSSCARTRTAARSCAWATSRAPKSACSSTSSTARSTARRPRSSPSTSSRARTASIVSDGGAQDDGGHEDNVPGRASSTSIALDTNDFVRLSIEEVINTLFEAIVLVVLVVYLFLQSFRTTIICTVAIVVALIATFTGMLALGFSINLLTLFGLVLAIGMVVDDAIVVVENVERNMAGASPRSPKEATIKSMEEIVELAGGRRARDGRCSFPRRFCPARPASSTSSSRSPS